jgi:DNA-binding MarR family transcriptional regulator
MYGDALREFAEASADDVVHLLALASRSTMRTMFERLADRGHSAVRLAHVPVFSGLDPEGTRISELAARAGISRQAMSVLVRDLESAGYVTSRPDPTDLRAVIVELDRKGADFCRDAVVVSSELNREAGAALGSADLNRMRDGLRALVTPSDDAAR